MALVLAVGWWWQATLEWVENEIRVVHVHRRLYLAVRGVAEVHALVAVRILVGIVATADRVHAGRPLRATVVSAEKFRLLYIHEKK